MTQCAGLEARLRRRKSWLHSLPGNKLHSLPGHFFSLPTPPPSLHNQTKCCILHHCGSSPQLLSWMSCCTRVGPIWCIRCVRVYEEASLASICVVSQIPTTLPKASQRLNTQWALGNTQAKLLAALAIHLTPRGTYVGICRDLTSLLWPLNVLTGLASSTTTTTDAGCQVLAFSPLNIRRVGAGSDQIKART